MVRANGLRNLHGVLRLINLQQRFIPVIRQLPGFFVRRPGGHRVLHSHGVLPTRQQIVFRGHHFTLADGLRQDDILKHHHVTRCRHRIIRLGRHHQPERLQVGSHFDLRFVRRTHHQLAKILRTAFGSDGPEDIGEILIAEARRRIQVIEPGIDNGAAPLAIYSRVAFSLRHQDSTLEADISGPGHVLVIHCLQSSGNYGDVINGRGFLWRGESTQCHQNCSSEYGQQAIHGIDLHRAF